MKRMLITVMTVGLLAMMGRPWVYAQDQDTEPDLKANIPFRFTVADTSLPAGEYTIKRVDDTNPGALEIRSANNRVSVVFLTESAQAEHSPTKSDLVFNKVGSRYFLSQVWEQGDKTGEELAQPRAERKLEKLGGKSERQSVDCISLHHHMKTKVWARGE
jgi:hypothetical protein